MAAQAISKEFKSPKHKLISFFHAARDKWRARAQQYRRTARSLNITARDLRKSRDAWKQKYMSERERRLALQAQLGRPSAPALKFCRLTTAAVSHPGR
jgi:hypothetical protein